MNFLRGVPVLLGLTLLMASSCSFMDKHFRKVSYPKDSVGALINDRFRRLVKDCRVVPADEDVKDSDYEGRSFLPNNFAMSQQDLDEVPISQPWHSSLVFLYPFTKSERDAFVAGKEAPRLDENHVVTERRIISDGLGVDVLPTRAGGIDAILYKQSCASYVSAEAGGGVKFPLASVQSALSSQFSVGARASLATGFFRSPFADMLGGGGVRALYARLLLWERYHRSPELVTADGLFALVGFKGAAVLGATASSSGTKVSLDANAGGATPVASGSASLGARYESQTQYSSETFLTLLSALRASSFTRLDNPSEIKAAVLASSGTAVVEPMTAMVTGQVHEHRVRFVGLTNDSCEAAWAASAFSPANLYVGTPTVRGIASVSAEAALPECTFVIRGTPSAGIVTGSAPSVSYTLTGGSTVTVDTQPMSLEIRVSGVNFAVNSNPQWIPHLASTTPDPLAVGTQVRWRWEVPIEIRDSGNPIVRDRKVEVKLDKVTCKRAPQPDRDVPVSAQVMRNESTQQYTLRVETVGTYAPPGAGAMKTEACRIEPALELPLEGGLTASRPVSFVIDVPKEETPPTPPSAKDVADLVDSIKSMDRLLKAMVHETP